MRKLKLQMQQTVDGYVARQNGELDWMQVIRVKSLQSMLTI